MPLVGPYAPYRSRIRGMAAWSARRKLLASLIPSVLVILMITGYVTHWFSSHYLNIALERAVQLQTLAQAHALEILFEHARQDLLELAKSPAERERLAAFLQVSWQLRGNLYRELAFIGLSPEEDIFLVADGGEVLDIPPADIALIRPNPELLTSKANELRPWETMLAEATQTSYPLSSRAAGARLNPPVIRLATPVHDHSGRPAGCVVLGLNANRARDVLSLYNSTKSPMYAFPRTAEKRYSYFFDQQGWMLFQSESLEESERDLSTAMARSGLSGDYSKPGLDVAFRPNPEHAYYWQMVVGAQNGEHGVITIDPATMAAAPSTVGNYSLGFAPVRFHASPHAPPQVIGGVGFMDKSRLTTVAEMRQYDVMAIITVTAMAVLTLVIYVVSRTITRPTQKLEEAVSAMLREGKLKEIVLPDHDYETSSLKQAVNRMIIAILSQREEIRLKTLHIQDARQREPVILGDARLAGAREGIGLGEMVGSSPAMESLRAQIAKAASVDADVLIIGETGSGKELTAEAIHKHSVRRDKPFISVNCGALDENLLLDALFGHVKGAFSEARTDRKGAFQSAHGGTLFLDEIGNASPKVQQALLRTLSVRRVRPLGSDEESDVDVRLVAATNVDLRESIRKGLFREDLYYRLKVLTIDPPPLRERKEDIPVLADHFLREAAGRMNRTDLLFSRGALDQLLRHDWPGNVRELKNCITRAVAMTEQDVIQAEDLLFDEPLPPERTRTETSDPAQASPAVPDQAGTPARPVDHAGPSGRSADQPDSASRSAERARRPASVREPARGEPAEPAVSEALGLNPRQRKALPTILERGRISRLEYQQLVEEDLPLRTAQYDLHDLIKKGVLKKIGKGPATRYVVQSPLPFGGALR